MKITKNQLRSLINEEVKQLNEINLRSLSKKVNKVFQKTDGVEIAKLELQKIYSNPNHATRTLALLGNVKGWRDALENKTFSGPLRNALSQEIIAKLDRIQSLIDSDVAAALSADVAATAQATSDAQAATDTNTKLTQAGIKVYQADAKAKADAAAKAKEGVVAIPGDTTWEYKHESGKWHTRRQSAAANSSWYSINKLPAEDAAIANARLYDAHPGKKPPADDPPADDPPADDPPADDPPNEGATLFESRLRKLAGL